jgi:hypothetical protein
MLASPSLLFPEKPFPKMNNHAQAPVLVYAFKWNSD